MKINIFIERTGEMKKIETKSISELFSKLSINKETVLIVKNNELVTEDEPIIDGDEIKFLSVISGG